MNAPAVVRLAVIAVVLAACAAQQPPPPPPPDEAAIRSAIAAELAKFGPVISAKDAAGASKLFTEDGTWILPDATTFTGRANIEAGAKKFFESFQSVTFEASVIDKLVVI